MSTLTIVFVLLICVAVIVALVIFWKSAGDHERTYKESVAQAMRNRPTLLSIQHAGGGSYHAAIAAAGGDGGGGGGSSSGGTSLGAPSWFQSRGARRVSYSAALGGEANGGEQEQPSGGPFPRHAAWTVTPDTSMQSLGGVGSDGSAVDADGAADASRAASILNVSVRNKAGGGGAVLGYNAPNGVTVPKVVAVRDTELLGAARTRLDHTLNAAFDVLYSVGDETNDDGARARAAKGSGGGLPALRGSTATRDARAASEPTLGVGRGVSAVVGGGAGEATQHAPLQAPRRPESAVLLVASADGFGSESVVDTDAPVSTTLTRVTGAGENDATTEQQSERIDSVVDADTALVMAHPKAGPDNHDALVSEDTAESVPPNPDDVAVLQLFPVELLRSDRDTYQAALQANQAKLSKPQLRRLRVLRRKELFSKNGVQSRVQFDVEVVDATEKEQLGVGEITFGAHDWGRTNTTRQRVRYHISKVV